MANPLGEHLKKQINDLKTKGALRTKHEDLQLENLQVKLKAMDRTLKGKG